MFLMDADLSVPDPSVPEPSVQILFIHNLQGLSAHATRRPLQTGVKTLPPFLQRHPKAFTTVMLPVPLKRKSGIPGVKSLHITNSIPIHWPFTSSACASY